MALNIGRGDEVIVPDITWVSASVVQAVGAKPIFADVRLEDWTLKQKLGKVNYKKYQSHYASSSLWYASKENLKKISKKYKLKIIEDAAPAIGSSYKNCMWKI